ncbi:MAG: AAA family ATPase [Candidatus Thiodiazotropha sp.]
MKRWVYRTDTDVPYVVVNEEGEPINKKGPVEAVYRFKCSQRTQDIRIENANISIGDVHYVIKWSSSGYSITNKNTSSKVILDLAAGFLFDPESMFVRASKSIVHFLALINAQSALAEELKNTFYLGPFREAPRRKYATRSANPAEVGPMGESAVTMLANESFQTQKRPHIKQIAKWLNKLQLAKYMNISRVGKSDLVDLKIGLNDGAELPIADLGYGLSQILPVLTQCSFAKEKSTLLFEQPEIHLHTKSSRHLASVMIETAKIKKGNVVLETHSPDLVKQLMQEMKAGNISANDVALYKVSRDNKETCIHKIEVDVENDFDVYENWEKGIST